jgi:hypothetical protein
MTMSEHYSGAGHAQAYAHEHTRVENGAQPHHHRTGQTKGTLEPGLIGILDRYWANPCRTQVGAQVNIATTRGLTGSLSKSGICGIVLVEKPIRFGEQ